MHRGKPRLAGFAVQTAVCEIMVLRIDRVRIGADSDPVALFDLSFFVHELIFQYAAVVHDGLCGADIVLFAGYQHALDPELSALVERETDHLGCAALSALARTDAAADVSALAVQGIVQIMADVHRAQKPVAFLVEQEKDRIRHLAVSRLFGAQMRKIVIKVVIIVFEDRPRRAVRVVFLLIRLPLVDHLAELLLICFCELDEFQSHELPPDAG